MSVRVLAAISWVGLVLSACESSQVQPQPEPWSSSAPAPTLPEPTAAPEPVAATAVESTGAGSVADTAEPPIEGPALPSALPVQDALPPAPPPSPPPKLRAQLSGLEAQVEGTELVVRAALSGQLLGSELAADRVELVVELRGPSGHELISRDGSPLQLRLVVQEPELHFRVGAVSARFEGRLPLDDLALAGEGLHQIVPELTTLAADGVVLEPQEQFPYVWITRTKDEASTSGINDARVLGPKR